MFENYFMTYSEVMMFIEWLNPDKLRVEIEPLKSTDMEKKDF